MSRPFFFAWPTAAGIEIAADLEQDTGGRATLPFWEQVSSFGTPKCRIRSPKVGRTLAMTGA